MESNEYLDRSAEAAVGALAGELAERLAAPTDALFGRQLERINSLLQRGGGSGERELRRLDAAVRQAQGTMRRTLLGAVGALPDRLRRELRTDLERAQRTQQEWVAHQLEASTQGVAQECDRLFTLQHGLLQQFDELNRAMEDCFAALEQRLAEAEAGQAATRDELTTFRTELTSTLGDWSERLGAYVDSLAPRLEKQQDAFTRRTLLPEIERLFAEQDKGEDQTAAALAELRAGVDANAKRTKQALVAAILAAAAAIGALIAAIAS